MSKFLKIVLSFVLLFNLCANPTAQYLKEIAAGYTFGTIGWCIGANLGNAVFGKKSIPICGYPLYGMSSSMGVWLVGKQHNGGNYLYTLRWTVGFPLVIMGVGMMCGIQLSTRDKLVWFSVPIGSFIGYNLSIKKRK